MRVKVKCRGTAMGCKSKGYCSAPIGRYKNVRINKDRIIHGNNIAELRLDQYVHHYFIPLYNYHNYEI